MIGNLLDTLAQIKQDTTVTSNVLHEKLYINQSANDSGSIYRPAYIEGAGILPKGFYLVEAIVTGTSYDYGNTSIGVSMQLSAQSLTGTELTAGSLVALVNPSSVRVKTQAALGTAASATEIVKAAGVTSSNLSLNAASGYDAYSYAIFKAAINCNYVDVRKLRLSFGGFSVFNTVYFKITKISN